jgi:hypothetical protein
MTFMEQGGGGVQTQGRKQFVGSTTKMLKKFPTAAEKRKNLVLIFGSIFVVLAGVVSGWFLSGRNLGVGTSKLPSGKDSALVESETEAGLADESLFPDVVEGTLVEGGIENEGTHHLERPGGPSQNVYLTSTVIDLQSFVGKKVKVWGETISGQTAGWLMDVVKVKVID